MPVSPSPRIGAGYHLRYTVDGKGRIQVEATYQPEKEDIPLMPKFGMRMRMPSALNRIAWYGRGKFENYPDRKSAAFLGVYECGIHEFITNYIVPQDNANRCDTRWFMLGDSERWKNTSQRPATPMFPYMALRGRRPGRERACARTARTRLHQPEYRLQHTRSRWKRRMGRTDHEAIHH